MTFQPAQRLGQLPTYLFVDIDRKKRAAIAAGKDVINFGIGDPDQPTPEYILERMHSAVREPANHRYPAGEGAAAFRQCVAEFFEHRYRVKLDPQREILALIGSKEGLGHLPLAAVNPGQTVIVPDPAYPVYSASVIMAGGVPWTLRLHERDGWLPNLAEIPESVARAAVLMYLNYPNNPTGSVCSREFLRSAVEFCHRHEILLAQDAAYNEMCFDEPAHSVLEIDGARRVAVEFHSLSKTFNMTGWRLGFAVGNADVLAALAKVKSNVDSGPFSAIQEAGISALTGIARPENAARAAMYRERSALLTEGLRELGFRVQPPRATFYVWAGVPGGYEGMTVSGKLLEEAAVVCIPGAGFGPAGRDYVRFAVTVDTQRIREALARMRNVRW